MTTSTPLLMVDFSSRSSFPPVRITYLISDNFCKIYDIYKESSRVGHKMSNCAVFFASNYARIGTR